MKPEEVLVERFLNNLGYKSIEYEPLGESTPPDFKLCDNVAVEVRRLNKHVFLNGKNVPIEDLKYTFVPKFRKMLGELENPDLPYSISLSLVYSRPINVNRQLLTDLKKSIIQSTTLQKFSIEIDFNDNITYTLFKDIGKSNQTYELMGIQDRDSGGIVQIARYDALKIAIMEKSIKLKDVKPNYKELWLILVDNIFSRVDYTTKQDLEREPEIFSIFDRIILISNRDITKWIDLYPWKIIKN